MKRLLYIFIAFVTLAAATPECCAQTISPQLQLSSDINGYEAGVLRNTPGIAQSSFNSAMTIISNEINSLNQQIQNTTNQSLIATLTAKKNAEQQIYNDLQALQNNLTGNFAQIKSKLKDFLAMM